MIKEENQDVQVYLKTLEHPLKAELLALREIILSSNKALEENIKWNAPNYSFNGEDRITFNLSKKNAVRIIFHCGAKVKDSKSKTPIMKDESGLLEWLSNDRAIASFANATEILKREKDLRNVVQLWLGL